MRPPGGQGLGETTRGKCPIQLRFGSDDEFAWYSQDYFAFSDASKARDRMTVAAGWSLDEGARHVAPHGGADIAALPKGWFSCAVVADKNGDEYVEIVWNDDDAALGGIFQVGRPADNRAVIDRWAELILT